jgi:SAM-dependent methyltransferase
MNDKLITSEEAVIWLREQSNMQEAVRHCYFDDPVEAAAERFSNSEEWQAVRELLKGYLPGKVLDIGAGRGISSYAFAKAGCNVTALEPDPSIIVGSSAIQLLLKKTNLSIEIVQEYGETLPFSNNSFDIVYVRAVLHHAQDLQKFCQEVSRVLKKGGIFIATREHVISAKEDLQEFLDQHLLHFLHGNENAYLLNEYKSAIERAGLTRIRIINPFGNVINYAPQTQQYFQSNVIAPLLQRKFGSVLSKLLLRNKVINNICAEYLSFKSNTPGRLYTFLASKQ